MQIKQIEGELQTARRGALMFTAVALAGTVAVGWMLYNLLGRSAGGERGTPVVVAAREMPPFCDIRAEDLKVVNWPASSVPDGAYKDVKVVLKTPMRNLRTLLSGEPLVRARLSSQEAGIGMDYLVDSGMRAFVVQVGESIATARLLQPGMFVDVVSTIRDPKAGDTMSRLVLEYVEVLAIGDVSDPTVENARAEDKPSDLAQREELTKRRVVTLLVTPKQVEYLALAKAEGTIDLALRNSGDSEVVQTPGVSRSALLGSDSRPPESLRGVKTKLSSTRTRHGPAVYRVGQ